MLQVKHITGVLTLLALCATTPATFAQVSGIVVDRLTSAPIEGAIVSVRATTIRTVSLADGSFNLPGATGTNLLVVGAMKGYYNEPLFVSGGTSGTLLALEAVPQNDDPGYFFEDPVNCGSCHPDQLAQWTDSPMSKGGTNSWVYDIYNGTGSPGGLGGFVYTLDSVHAATQPDADCASCHQPQPWVERGSTGSLEDIDSLSPGAMHGISCDICHKIAHIDESKLNYPGLWPGVTTLTRPASGDTQVQYGVLGDSFFPLWSIMRPSYQPQLTAAVCAACHQDKNDPDENHDFEEPNGVISEPTYLEWLDSPYADPTSRHAATCVDCHMPSYGATKASDNPFAPDRDPETIRHHRIEGTTAAFLENAVEMDVRAKPHGSQRIAVNVNIKNTLTGHHVPTGVTVRNMILLVEAWSLNPREKNRRLTDELGRNVIHDLGGIGSPQQGYYAGLPGKLYAKVNHDSTGAGPTFFTDATGIQFDTRIPAMGNDRTEYRFQVPAGTDEVIVRARLIYRRCFRFLVDAKDWKTDGHGAPLEDIQAPHFGHLMESWSKRIRMPQSLGSG